MGPKPKRIRLSNEQVMEEMLRFMEEEDNDNDSDDGEEDNLD